MNSEEDKSSLDDEKVAFEYFKIHSTQRTTHFNYFLVGCTALLATLVDEELSEVQITILGLFLSCLSIAFYYFDLRNKELVKISEEYLAASAKEGSENFFSFVEKETQLRRESYPLFRRLFRSHGRVYKILYISFFLTGVAFAVFGFTKIILF